MPDLFTVIAFPPTWWAAYALFMYAAIQQKKNGPSE